MGIWEIILPVTAGAGLSAWGAFHPRAQLFGHVISRVESGCALTFDDGPNPAATPRLLDLLDKHQVRGTFFLVGKHVRSFPEIAAEIAARGHSIGNHSDSHHSLVFFSRRSILDELKRCEDAIFRATGRRPTSVRPPFGFRGPQFGAAVRSAGLSKIVMWSVSARDWKLQPSSRVAGRLQKVSQGDIVLFHDGDHRSSNVDRSHTLQALEFWLPRWKDRGLGFVALQ